MLSSRLPHRIIFNSRAARCVKARFGYDVSKMEYIPNGFETDNYRPCQMVKDRLRSRLRIDPSTQLVGMCGRYHPHKGHRDFFESVTRLAARQPDIQFALIGRDVESANAELRSLVDATGHGGRIHLLGEWPDTSSFFPALDLLVLPSITEAMPNVVGEAMSCGVPCVVTDVGDAAHLVGDTGMVVPVGNATAMSDAIERQLAAIKTHPDNACNAARKPNRTALRHWANHRTICQGLGRSGSR